MEVLLYAQIFPNRMRLQRLNNLLCRGMYLCDICQAGLYLASDSDWFLTRGYIVYDVYAFAKSKCCVASRA